MVIYYFSIEKQVRGVTVKAVNLSLHAATKDLERGINA